MLINKTGLYICGCMAKKKPSRKQKNFRRTKWLLKGTVLVAFVAFFYAPLARNFSAFASWTSDLLDDYHYRHIESFGIRMPTRYQVHGIDVSRYQGRIDWEKVAAMESDDIRISFAYIKATEGMFLVDRYFKRNWRESREHGILRGAYHYFKPRINGKTQARLFLQTVKHEAGDLPPVIDIEETSRLSPEKFRERLTACLKAVEEEVGVKPIIYTGLNFYETYLEGYFAEYPFWIAHYYHSRPRLSSDLEWRFWQHSDSGRLSGIDHKVDFNVFSGGEEALQKMCIPSGER